MVARGILSQTDTQAYRAYNSSGKHFVKIRTCSNAVKAVVVLRMNLTYKVTALVFVALELAGKAFCSHRQPSVREEMAGIAGHNRFPFLQV